MNKAKKSPPAPEPYRPQSLPKCLQLKSRQPSTNPRVPQLPVKNTAGPPKAAALPRAPAVYRPLPKTSNTSATKPAVPKNKTTPPLLPTTASRPQATSQTLQRKTTPLPRSNNIPIRNGNSPAAHVASKGVLQRSEGPGPSPDFASLARTPLLSYINPRDLSSLAKTSRGANRAVKDHRFKSKLRIALPPELEDRRVYGRAQRDYPHPLYDAYKSWEREALEESMAMYVDMAYQNMVSLVQRYGKDCDVPQDADRIAETLAGSNEHWRKGNCVAVIVRRGKGPKIALNELTKRNKETKESLDPSAHQYLSECGGEFIDLNALQYEHCEIRLWEQYGKTVQYIGIMQPCCLYCAAQLLAAGFTGFRGCHMNVYDRYTFSEKILLDTATLRTLFGEPVLEWYGNLDAKGKLDFLDLLAVGRGVREKLTKITNKRAKIEKS